jgi:radical SAM superfamily enzyme YgiQ (UPF0313 family)
MPSRILLISANRCTNPERVFPLGLTYLQAALRQAGHQCLWFDLLDQAEQLEATLEKVRPDFAGISLRNIDDVIIRKQQTFFEDLPSICATIRRHKVRRIILGGSGFTIFPGPLLELSGADFGIAGEGEYSLVRLLKCLEEGAGHETIPGLVHRKDGRVAINPPEVRPFDGFVTEVDRPVSVVERYRNTSGVLNVQTQRGCSYRCCYCTYPIVEGRGNRRRPAELVAEEFAQLERLKVKYAFIVDSVFNSSRRHVSEVCEAILRRGVKISWGCFLRPQGLTADLMRLMSQAGLAHVEFGSDSFCDDVLQACQKGFTFEDILHSTELARQVHMDCCHFLIAGGPGETMASLRQSFENAKQLRDSTIMAVVGMRIYPQTDLYGRAVAEGQIESEENLLFPHYYLAPGLNKDAVFEQLREFARLSPNWVVGDPAPAYTELVERLRRRGVVGPLWSYFSAIQRLWPKGAESSPFV